MSEQPPDQQFWNIADAFIAEANSQVQGADRAKVSAALLYAAARFNAFVSATAMTDEASFRASRAEALEYFTSQYSKMLGENLDDWAANFSKYMAQKGGDGA